MKYNKINTLTGVLMLFLAIIPSCMDLTEAPENRLPPDAYYLTVSQCQTALTGVLNLYAPDTWNGIKDHPEWPDGTMNASFNWSSSYGSGYWNTGYTAMMNLNPVIKSIKAGNLSIYDPVEVNDIMGQAYFLRGWIYFNLVRMYGKIPYITEDTPDVIANPLTPASREEVSAVYDKIEADLLNAIEKMPNTKSISAKPSIWAAKALLARVYVNRATAPLKQTEYYAKARDMADDVIVNGPNSFTENLSEIFNIANVKNNPEFIWGLNGADDHTLCVGLAIGPDDWGCYSGGTCRPLWAETYPEQPRKYMYVLYTFPLNLDLTADPARWNWVHYSEGNDRDPFNGKRTWPNVPREIQISTAPFIPPLPILRYSDMLLVYAEAANMANGAPTQLAVDRLNMIIDRSNQPFQSVYGDKTSTAGTHPQATITMSKEDFDAKVMAERVWELCFESETFFDVIRKEKLYEVNEPDITDHYKAGNNYLFPIPDLDALRIGQNSDYN